MLKMTKKINWVKIKPEEIEKIVLDLFSQNINPEKIGLILRDQHGIPKVKLLGKKITQILRENNIETNSEYNNAVKKISNLKKHLEKNKHDYTSERSLIKYTTRINKQKKLIAINK